MKSIKYILTMGLGFLAASVTNAARYTPPESGGPATVMVNESNVLTTPTASVFINANFNSITPQTDAGLLGSAFNGASSISDWRIDTTWMDANYAKNLTASTGLLLDSGTTYNGKTARTITVDRAYIEQVIRETAFVVENYQILIDTSPSITGYGARSRDLTIRTPYSFHASGDYRMVKGSSTGNTDYQTKYSYVDQYASLTYWTDAEFKVLDANGNLIYWVSTQWGAQMGADYATHPAADLNAKIYYTSPNNEANGEGKGREWIEYVHNDVDARTIYEHAQTVTGALSPIIGGIIIQPNMNGTTVGGTSIRGVFGTIQGNTPNTNSYVYLKCSPLGYEKESLNNRAIWRPYNALSTAIQKAR